MHCIIFRYPKNIITDILLSLICLFVIVLILQNGETVYLSAVNLNNNDRVSFFCENGYFVDPTSEVECYVMIPEVFDDTFEEYNRLQIQQGFDLSEYCGKYVKRYTYKLKEFDNVDNPDDIFATLYVYGGRIIAADVYCSSINGFMMGVVNNERINQDR